jgi:hypothetical protein
MFFSRFGLFRALSALSFMALFFQPGPLWAWGAVGHKTIAWIAQDRLNPKAQRAVREILGEDRDLPSVSTWADAIVHMRPETAPWHYLNLNVREGQGQFDLETACRQQDCVVDQIEKDLQILREPFGRKSEKREALKFLVHFVGDLHQPLHCADDNDRGGNEKWFNLPGGKGRPGRAWICLHAYWDDLFLTPKSQSPRELAERLEAEMEPNDEADWIGGSPEQWAYESFLIAQKQIYGELPSGPLYKNRWGRELPEDYANGKMRKIMERQLQKAGVRLAFLLNDVLGR